MIDIRLVREQPEVVKAAAKNKQANVTAAEVDELAKLDGERRKLMEAAEGLRQRRNELAGETKKGKPTEAQIEKGRKLREELAKSEGKLGKVDVRYLDILRRIPNIPTDDVPVGASEDENVVAKTVAEPTKFDFEPKNHVQLAEAHDWIDKERAAKVAGSRFAYLKGGLVRLQFALMSWVADQLADEAVIKKIVDSGDEQLKGVSTKPFVPVLPPAVARTDVYEATGRLDREQQTYKLADDDLWLNASAEHTLAPMYLNEILDAKDLPLRYVGYTTAFRREAGTYGRDMEGILRMHQFDKLEMESFTTAADGLREHFFMIAVQEYLTHELEIPYHVLLKCTADIGKPNARGVDIEMWLPGQQKYRETHTADFISDYQTRRMQTRVRLADASVELAHTNDATAIALGRTLIAIIENNQQADGSVRVPKVLQKYYGRDLV